MEKSIKKFGYLFFMIFKLFVFFPGSASHINVTTVFPDKLNGFCSDVGNEVPTQTVNVVVPGEVFGFVYGENGSNLARLREV